MAVAQGLSGLAGQDRRTSRPHQTLIRLMQHRCMAIETPLTLLAIAALYNVVVFCVYWLDKHAARNGERRVPKNHAACTCHVWRRRGRVDCPEASPPQDSQTAISRRLADILRRADRSRVGRPHRSRKRSSRIGCRAPFLCGKLEFRITCAGQLYELLGHADRLHIAIQLRVIGNG